MKSGMEGLKYLNVELIYLGLYLKLIGVLIVENTKRNGPI